MKVLLIHPYGEGIGRFDHRIVRQIELMKQKVNLKIWSEYFLIDNLQEVRTAISKIIGREKPDVVYVLNAYLADAVRRTGAKYIYDTGSFLAQDLLVENLNANLFDDVKELKDKLESSCWVDYYSMEKSAVTGASAVINWGGREKELLEGIYGREVEEVCLSFCKLPKPLPFYKKKERVFTATSKWGRKKKNGKLVYKLHLLLAKKRKRNYLVQRGQGGYKGSNLSHGTLMNMMNNSKIFFAPYLSGGNGMIYEALKLGCNVMMSREHPLKHLVKKECQFEDYRSNNMYFTQIDNVMEYEYLPNIKIPTEDSQINKIIKICENSF